MAIAEKEILEKLKENGVEFELFEHKPVFTCEQAAKVRGVGAEDGIKCLLLNAGGKIILALTRGDKRLDLEKIALLEGAETIRLAKNAEIEKVALCKKGCVHPFCNVKTYVDCALAEKEWIEFNPGCHDKTIRIKVKNLLGLLEDSAVEKISP